MNYWWRKVSHRLWYVAVSLVLAAAAFGFYQDVKADIITEFGAGYKLDNTSVVLLPECHTVRIEEHTWPEGKNPAHAPRSCGGDDPLFIGWPIAWEKELSGPWTVRAGWFHMSHWFDGGKDRETHMDALVITAKFNWSKRKNRK